MTRTGRKFNVFEPDINVINIEDIAHALSMLTRFNGHLINYYSIAEHCYHISYLVPERYQLAALLHDAAEAYLSDLPSPIKAMFPEYKLIEHDVLSTIFKHYQVRDWSDDIWMWDKALAMKEAKDGGLDNTQFNEDYQHLPIVHSKLWFWDQHIAKRVFLERFSELTKGLFDGELKQQSPRDSFKTISVGHREHMG